MSSTPSSTTGRRRRLQEFSLPDGRRIIAALPDEIPHLRAKYANSQEIQVEVVLHGSDEHTGYLEVCRNHHTRRRGELRETYGDAFSEWEDVHSQLASVTEQLERLQDHSSSLNANFSKFGYHASLRTFDDDGGAHGGGNGDGNGRSGSVISDSSSASSWDDRSGGTTIKLFRRPVIKQYFHRGLLWRASEETTPMSFELFLDLLYVGIIHINGEHLAEEADGHELLRFVITFIMSWRIWCDIAQVMSWFETDDVFQRVEILFQLAALLGFTTNMIHSFYDDPKHNTYTLLVAFYLAARLLSAVHFALIGGLLPLVKGMMISQFVLIVVPSILWIASIHVEMPARLGLIWVAIVIDNFGNMPIVMAFRYSRTHATKLATRIGNFFEFYPAMNIEHKVERTNAFVGLVLGYSVIAVLFQNYGHSVNAFLGKAILGLVQAYMVNWLYFEVDGANIHMHAIRRSASAAFAWQTAHLFFIMGYIVATAGLSKLVVASDLLSANADDLAHPYHERSEHDLPTGIRYFYCHGLAIALLGMMAISLSHQHKKVAARRVPKQWRLGGRGAVCVVLFLLPLAKGLDSLELVAVTVGMVFVVLVMEIWGTSCRDDPFFGWKEGCGVQYQAKCGRRTLEGCKRDNGEVDVFELGRGEKTAVEVS